MAFSATRDQIREAPRLSNAAGRALELKHFCHSDFDIGQVRMIQTRLQIENKIGIRLHEEIRGRNGSSHQTRFLLSTPDYPSWCYLLINILKFSVFSFGHINLKRLLEIVHIILISNFCKWNYAVFSWTIIFKCFKLNSDVVDFVTKTSSRD